MVLLRILLGGILIALGLFQMIVCIKSSYKRYGKGGDPLGDSLNTQAIWGGAMLIFAGLVILFT